MIERERFPRFHVGESLLPCSAPMLEELGVVGELDARFVKKLGAEMITHDGGVERRYSFADGIVPHPASAWQVDRPEFDEILLRAAERAGAEIEQGSEVRSVEPTAAGATVRVRRGQEERELSARFVVDASGRASMLGARRGLREMDPVLKNVAVYSYFEGAQRRTGDRAGDITIVIDPGGWWWLIPLARDRMSVGFVGPKSAYVEVPSGRVRVCGPHCRNSGAGRAPCVGDSHRAGAQRERLLLRLPAGERRRLLVGRRCGGVFWTRCSPPVFTSGCCTLFLRLTPSTAALSRDNVRRSAFKSYERFVAGTLDTYRGLVRGFYTPELVEMFLAPSDRLDLRRAVTTLLAGAGTNQVAIAWRVGLFRALARANQHLVLAPRLTGRRSAVQA